MKVIASYIKDRREYESDQYTLMSSISPEKSNPLDSG